ncbi:hypothetical protein HanHA300_Chr03g0090581 [Helianthus annuus]|nr:hypothetical protein HanHA300_Chr03g0090581 [Helianthus annuus]KAJ0607873.1 hypothetical protein HanHA89_Chr03g0102251 [Helianthus annuus]KAJ0767937.1 hypothetical protein HanLR1_Chr03g0095581 [Helianthus annuus]
MMRWFSKKFSGRPTHFPAIAEPTLLAYLTHPKSESSCDSHIKVYVAWHICLTLHNRVFFFFLYSI